MPHDAHSHDETLPHSHGFGQEWHTWTISFLILIAIAIFDNGAFPDVISNVAKSVFGVIPFILLAVTSVAYLTASGADKLISAAFQKGPVPAIFGAAVIGALAPFCSCEVIPIIAALLAAGVSLAPVMAFWLASPLMDVAMFFMTAGVLGTEFAIAKTVAAIAIAISGGLIVHVLSRFGHFQNPLRLGRPTTCCTNESRGTDWSPWKSEEGRKNLITVFISNLHFLLRWLTLAYVVEAVTLYYIDLTTLVSTLNGAGVWSIIGAALIGGPAYLNGFAALPLVQTLLNEGLSQGAAMAFVIAGGISCVPAAIAVWALVRPRVFFAYVGVAFVGSILAGITWQSISG